MTLRELDGYEVAAKIRATEGHGAHVPIIMLTAERDVQQKVRALRAGADDYLIKPFHPAELLARMKSLIARFAPGETIVGRPPMGRIHAYYGAKGGVGTTTIAINAAIALQSLAGACASWTATSSSVTTGCSWTSGSIAGASWMSSAPPTMDADLIKSIVLTHDSGVDLLLAPPSPEAADLISAAHMNQILELLRGQYDYVIVDIDKRLDDVNLMVLDVADTIFAVMTADLSCLKNVRLVLETIAHLGYEGGKLKLVLNRSNAFTGINVKSAEGALRRPIEHQIVNEYRGAISALNSGDPFMVSKADSVLGRSVMDFAKAIDRSAGRRRRSWHPAPAASYSTDTPSRRASPWVGPPGCTAASRGR